MFSSPNHCTLTSEKGIDITHNHVFTVKLSEFFVVFCGFSHLYIVM